MRTLREISSAAFWRSERTERGENPQPPHPPPPPLDFASVFASFPVFAFSGSFSVSVSSFTDSLFSSSISIRRDPKLTANKQTERISCSFYRIKEAALKLRVYQFGNFSSRRMNRAPCDLVRLNVNFTSGKRCRLPILVWKLI